VKRFSFLSIGLFLCISCAEAQYFSFYKDSDFRNEMFFPPNIYDGIGLPWMGSGNNDRLSSIKGSGCIVLFEHEEYQGKSLFVYVSKDRSISNLKDFWFNDMTSSSFELDVISSTYCNRHSVSRIFEHPDANLYKAGLEIPMKKGPDGRIIKLPTFNDKASSAIVKKGECLKLWVDYPPSQSDTTNYNNWHLNPNYFIRGDGGLVNLPSGIQDEVSVMELVGC
jgi:hypothetical protein